MHPQEFRYQLFRHRLRRQWRKKRVIERLHLLRLGVRERDLVAEPPHDRLVHVLPAVCGADAGSPAPDPGSGSFQIP